MSLKPIPLTTDPSDKDSPKGAIPVDLYGVGGDSGPVTWENVQDKPSEFPPASHTHTIANVTGLQGALDGKQASGSYAAASHTHSAGDVDSGTFAVARIPDLAQSKISGLEARLSDIEDRLDALEP